MSASLNPEAAEFRPLLKTTVQEGYSQANKTIRTVNTFPIGTSYDLFQTFTDFGVVTCKIRENVVVQSNQIMVKELPTTRLKCHGEDENNTEKIIDANDSLLDRVNINIDTLSGVNVASEEFLRGVQPAAWNRAPVVATLEVNGAQAKFIGAKNIPRPQLSFKDPVDNSDTIFKPRIVHKPNQIKPLALTIQYDEQGEPEEYEHPYKAELEAYEPPEEFLQAGAPGEPPAALEATPLTYVDSPPALELLARHLAGAAEIAVDLEHHSYRTYQGFTCLVQITTDSGGDFIVDALRLRDHLHCLNESFTDPRKLKVFHGAVNDVLWLQRDFGVYVVGMFDTYQAARALQLPQRSLKYLLRRYCAFDVDKTYQVADWRMRPLPAELVRYARSDTHYLLGAARALRRELLAAAGRAALAAVFRDSRDVCLATYRKPRLTRDAHLAMYRRSEKRFSVAQLAALRTLYVWRDRAARDLDESTGYLLPNHMLLALAETLPRELQGVLACCRPLPPFVGAHLLDLHAMILSCRELPDEPQLFTVPTAVLGMAVRPRPLRPVHDLRARGDAPARARAAPAAPAAPPPADVRPFDVGPPARPAPRPAGRLNADAQTFVPPYDRYKIYRAVSQVEEIKDIKEKEAKVAAISRGNELIQEEVLGRLQRAHAELAGDAAPVFTARAPAERAARAPSPAGAPSPAQAPPPAPAAEHGQAQRKRKMHSERAPAPAATVYTNPKYDKFYSRSEKNHKHPKSKFKKRS